MERTASPPLLDRAFSVLVRSRMTQLRNAVDQQLRDAPFRTLSILGLLTLIWAALYFLLSKILAQVANWELVGLVANQHIFIQFFVVLSVMLAFSNAILIFSTLYGRDEAGALLAMPVPARHVVCIKWLEGVVLSSWSFLLLGVPLMLAVSTNVKVQWYYYPLFLAHFVGFVAIPACFGLLAAWAVAMFAPRRPMAIALAAGSVLIGGGLLGAWHISSQALAADEWLTAIFRQVSIVNQWWLPSTWTAKGIIAAMEHRVADSLIYLAYVFGNGVFLSWLTVNVLASTWPEAYSRAQEGRFFPTIRHGWPTELLCDLLFLYLPDRLRAVMLKDLRGFVRDARQWTQLVIMFGLLAIYVVNLRRLPFDLTDARMRALIAFLNLTTVSLIMATFTSRFVFPLLSLESHQLWLLEMLPARRFTLLMVKCIFSLTLTLLSGGSVMFAAVRVLGLPPDWAQFHMIICLGVCVGLSGMAIGLGARFPVLGERNPARIAAGFGGTFNLVASMLFVFVEMSGVAFVTFRELAIDSSLDRGLSGDSWQIFVGLVGLSVVVAAGSLWVGKRHFERLET